MLKLLILLPLALLAFNNCAKSDSSSVSATAADPSLKINTVGGWSDSPFISRDGQRLYFMYSRYNFGPWIKSGGTTMPVIAGPDRPGLHKSASNPWDESDYYMSTKNSDGSWGAPVNLGFNGAYGDSSGMEINNGATFIWLQGNGSTNNIVMATKNPNGSWGTPVDLGTGVNNHAAGVSQDNPHLSADGHALWFVSNRAGGSGGKDIWFTSYSGSWSAPVNLGSPVNTSGDEDQPWTSSVSTDVYWNGAGGVMHCLSNGSNCIGSPTTVVIPGCDYPGDVSLPDDLNTMYFACGTFATGDVKIMFSKKQNNGSWGTATLID